MREREREEEREIVCVCVRKRGQTVREGEREDETGERDRSCPSLGSDEGGGRREGEKSGGRDKVLTVGQHVLAHCVAEGAPVGCPAIGVDEEREGEGGSHREEGRGRC